MMGSLVLFVMLALPREDDVYLFGYRRGENFVFAASPLPLKDIQGNTAYLDHDAAAAFVSLLDVAQRENVKIAITYAYRTQEEQRKLYRRGPTIAAYPGYSNHQSGLSIDMRGCIGRKGSKTKLYYWMKKVGPRFGWINDIANEPWHWTYVGIEQARQWKSKKTTRIVADTIYLDLN